MRRVQSLRHLVRWCIGKKEDREWPGGETIYMEATPWGWESAGGPYHTMPVPSPQLVPRPLRPVWALLYYLPIYVKERAQR